MAPNEIWYIDSLNEKMYATFVFKKMIWKTLELKCSMQFC